MPRPLEPGRRLGSYTLVRCIGVGGMAEVWLARRTSERRANKFVAIKVVADSHVGDPRFQRMFKAEVDLSALLTHVNIVQVFDEGEDDGRRFLVMEWVDGVSLLKLETALGLIVDEPWRLRVIAYVIGQLLYALQYAHRITLHDGDPLGIVHRDVTPHNVLVSAQGEVKLTDFGVAHYLLEESSGAHVKGKLRYMAPEQLAGHTRDPRVDLYAVGAILHELLDGRPFRYHVEDQRDMYIEVLSGRIPPLSRPVPPELDELRLRLLEPDPKQRIPTADAALDGLARFPGYGDARRELAKLCGEMTGVLRPRVGPAPSAPVRAAGEASGGPSTLGASKTEPVVTPGEPAPRVAKAEATQRLASSVSGPGHSGPTAPGTAMVSAPGVRGSSTSRRLPAKARRQLVPWVLVGVLVIVIAVMAQWPVDPPLAASTLAPEPPPGRVEVEPPTIADGPGPARVAAPERHEASSTSSDPSDAREPEREESGATGQPVEPEGTGTTGRAEAPDEPPGSDADVDGPPPPAAVPSRPRIKQGLSLFAAEALGAVQVEVRDEAGRKRRYDVRGRHKGERVPTGTYWAKWRRAGETTWSASQRVMIRRGCDLRIVVAATGMSMVAMGNACR